MIFHRFRLGELLTNCYLIADEITKNAVVFDAPDNAEKILEYLNENGLTLKKILLTHAHFDHILALKPLMDATNAGCVLHEIEEQYLLDPALNLAGDKADEMGIPESYTLIKDNDTISVDGLKIKVIHTPGHTAGSVCYLVNDATLISGDTLFSGSIGRFDFPLGSFENEINSIKNKLMILDDEVKVCPGHGFSTTIGKQRKDNPYLI